MERSPDSDRAKLNATTEEDIRRDTIEDGFDPNADLVAGGRSVLPPVEVRALCGMTQAAFAA